MSWENHLPKVKKKTKNPLAYMVRVDLDVSKQIQFAAAKYNTTANKIIVAVLKDWAIQKAKGEI